MIRETRRELHGRFKVEIVELSDSFGAVHQIQQPLMFDAKDEDEHKMLVDWTEAVIENEKLEMERREQQFIRMATARGHRLPAEIISAAELTDCPNCGK